MRNLNNFTQFSLIYIPLFLSLVPVFVFFRNPFLMRSTIKLWFPVTTGLVKLVLEGSGWLAWRLCIHTAPCLVPAVLSRTCQFLKWAEDQYITCYISLSSLTQTACLRGKEITSVPAHRILASYHLRVSARSREKEKEDKG